jgi:hypothetical protein
MVIPNSTAYSYYTYEFGGWATCIYGLKCTSFPEQIEFKGSFDVNPHLKYYGDHMPLYYPISNFTVNFNKYDYWFPYDFLPLWQPSEDDILWLYTDGLRTNDPVYSSPGMIELTFGSNNFIKNPENHINGSISISIWDHEPDLPYHVDIIWINGNLDYLNRKYDPLFLTPESMKIWQLNEVFSPPNAENVQLELSKLGIDVNALDLLYKSDFIYDTIGYDSGLYENNYQTIFDQNFDPNGATISFDTGHIIQEYASLFLLVKDGAHWNYLYDLNYYGWQGIEDIILSGFGPPGSISHIAIFGSKHPVPEPSTILLLGAGLGILGIVVMRRRKNG